MKYMMMGPADRLGAASLPIAAALGQGYQSWGAITGSPGTTMIPAPAPWTGRYDTSLIAQAIQGVGSGGMGEPASWTPFWRPGIYYIRELASRFHGALYSDNQMPVPAMPPSNILPNLARYQKKTTQPRGVVGWPIVLPDFQWINRTSS